MAQHWTLAQIQAIFATQVQNLKPYQLNALMDALARTSHVEDPDYLNGADESTIGTIFASGNNP